jgi:23S rRNA (cytosine1962-C5)-methyltransferase
VTTPDVLRKKLSLRCDVDTIFLKPGREKSLRLRHPWIFSGAIDRVRGVPQAGDTVDIQSSAGEWLGRAAYSPLSNIRARVWTFDSNEVVDAALLRKRLESALALRKALIPEGETDALRLVHGESDGLPGVIVDRYAGWLVIQCLTAAADGWKDTIVDTLVELTGISQVYERSDVDVRRLEGLPERAGMVRGEAAPEMVTISENGLKFAVDVRAGQKTGFYIDQRHNRQRVRQLSAGRETLNCFCYTGSFSAYALAGGARSVLSVDSSGDALKAGAQNLRLNGLDEEKATWLEGDVFQVLRKLRDQGRSFDLVILDPPKFAPTAAQVEQAARGYKDINLLAFKLLRPGGLLFTFSCSGGVTADLFQKIVAGAALDARVDARLLEHLGQGVDHPVALNFPEGTYLKGLVVARM